jgi:hypothetical protein
MRESHHAPRVTNVLVFLQITVLSTILTGAELPKWKASRAELIKDKSLIRLYSFAPDAFAKNGGIKNLAGNNAGTMFLDSRSPYCPTYSQKWKYEYPQWTEGRFPGKSALTFSTAPNAVMGTRFYNTGTAQMTLEAWVRVHHTPGKNSKSFMFSEGTGFGSGWHISSSSYKTEFRLGRPKKEGGDIALAGPKLTSGVWHHLVAQIDKNSTRLYIDGKPASEKSFTGTYKQLPTHGGHFSMCPEEDQSGLMLGSIQGLKSSDPFDCDEVAIFDKALSPKEILRHYESGRPELPAEEQIKTQQAKSAVKKLASQISVSLPNHYYGYFPRAFKLPVSVKISEQVFKDTKAPLIFKAVLKRFDGKVLSKHQTDITASTYKQDKESLEIPLPEICGLYWLATSLENAAGSVIKETTFPIATTVPVPEMSKRPDTSPIAAFGTMSRWPESAAVGALYERILSPWRPKKADGTYNWTWTDDVVNHSLKNGKEIMFCIHAHSYSQPALNKVLNGDDSEWEEAVRSRVERYKGKVKYWEICNEPNARGCTPLQYVALAKTAHRVIREVDPKAKIVGLCGVSSYPEWTEEVLAKGGGATIDVLSFHNYIGNSPISTWRQYHKIERVKNSMRKHLGKVIPIWNTEVGIHQPQRVNGKILNDSELLAAYPRGRNVQGTLTSVPADAVGMTTEHTSACWQVSSILLDCALGTERHFILMGASSFYPRKNQSAGSPTEKGMALAALSSFLGDMKDVKLIPLNSSRSAGVLVTLLDGRRVAALFSDVPVTCCFTAKQNQTYQGMDFIGNPLKFKSENGVLPVSFNMEPVYLFDVPENFAEIPILSVDQFPERISPNSKVSSRLTISNPFSAHLDGVLEIRVPESSATYEKQISLEPGAKKTVPFALNAGPLSRGKHELVARLFCKGKALTVTEQEFASEGVARGVPKLAAPIKLDGDASEWKHISAEVADNVNNIVIGKPPVGYRQPGTWEGAEDLSFSLKTAWRPKDGVYFLLTVVDDKLKTVSADNVGRSFLQDGIEFFFDGRSLKKQSPVYSFGTEQILIVPAINDKAETCVSKNLAKYGASVDLEMVGRKTDSGYLIEGCIRPQKGSPFKLVAGTRFGMDMLVDDANDSVNMSRKTQMALHGSAANCVDTSQFGRYRLLDKGAGPQSPNLIKNSTFKKNKDGSISNWHHDDCPADFMFSSKEVDGKPVLWIRSKAERHCEPYWSQMIPVSGKTGYTISCRMGGRVSGKAVWDHVRASVAFLAPGKWLGHKSLGAFSVSQSPDSWGTFSENVMTPSGTTHILIKCGILSKGIEDTADFYWSDLAVRKSSDF